MQVSDIGTAHADQMFDRIEFDVTTATAPLLGSTGRGAWRAWRASAVSTRRQFVHAERFGDVVVSTARQPGDFLSDSHGVP